MLRVYQQSMKPRIPQIRGIPNHGFRIRGVSILEVPDFGTPPISEVSCFGTPPISEGTYFDRPRIWSSPGSGYLSLFMHNRVYRVYRGYPIFRVSGFRVSPFWGCRVSACHDSRCHDSACRHVDTDISTSHDSGYLIHDIPCIPHDTGIYQYTAVPMKSPDPGLEGFQGLSKGVKSGVP